MAEIAFKSGEMASFVADVEFGLNFDEKNIPSVKVKKGDTVKYDGFVASYIDSRNDSEVKGKTISLRRAIAAGWLVLVSPDGEPVETDSQPRTLRQEPIVPGSNKQYDSLRGGNFDEHMARSGEIVTQKMPLVREEDQVVKITESFSAKTEQKPPKPQKFEIAGDQVGVGEVKKEATSVTSSTVVPKSQKYSTKIVQAEDYGADSVTPINLNRDKKSEKKAPNTYTVDDKTPRMSEDATGKEVQSAKRIINADESQDAKVVGSVRGKKTASTSIEVQDAKVVGKVGGERVVQQDNQEAQVVGAVGTSQQTVKELEGVTLRTPDTTPKHGTKEGITFAETSAPREPSSKVTVKSGSTPVSDPSTSEKKSNNNYLSMLPDNWGDMHWTQKEKFIKQQDDIEFLKFIKMVETVNAVQKACDVRIKQLESKSG